MKISKISQQKKASNRYSIYVDDEFFLGIDQEVLIQFGLYKDQEVDQALLDKVNQAENKYKVYSKAINYLSYGLRSRKELRDYLKNQDFQLDNPIKVIEATLDRLTSQGYLNDLEFAKAYVRTMANINYKGPQLISQELKQRGIDEHMIADSLEEYPQDLRFENIHRLANKYIQQKTKLPTKMLQQKLKQHLISKGYDGADINQVMEDLDTRLDQDQEETLLSQAAQKQLIKYRRKYQGYELQRRLSQSLFGKGYDYSTIQSWIERHKEEFEEDESID